jgi:uncharacterized protein (TIGR02145 family)
MKKNNFFYFYIFALILLSCSSDDPVIESVFVYNEIEIEGDIWMDRNLGAESPYDAGWYFQWGRPADGHQIVYPDRSDTTFILSPTTNPGHNQFIMALQGIAKHWMEDPIYDYFALTEVCPEGWRVPDKEDYEKLLNHIAVGSREGIHGAYV